MTLDPGDLLGIFLMEEIFPVVTQFLECALILDLADDHGPPLEIRDLLLATISEFFSSTLPFRPGRCDSPKDVA